MTLVEIIINDKVANFLDSNKIFLSPHGDSQPLGFRFQISPGIEIERYVGFYRINTLCAMRSFSYSRSPLPLGTSVGRYSSIGTGVKVLGIRPVTSRVTTSNFVYERAGRIYRAYDDDYGFSGPILARSTQPWKAPTIGNDVWIDQDVILGPGVVIGDGAVITAGSVIREDVPAYTVARGDDRDQRRLRFSLDLVAKFLRVRWWEFSPTVLGELSLAKPHEFISQIEKVRESLVPFSPGTISGQNLIDCYMESLV